MGKNAPKAFARSDRKIVVSGLLEPVCATAYEHEVREEILAVIHQADVADMNFSKCTSLDFEFIQVSAKSASVPTVREGFSRTGDAVKSLAGQGAVYVRSCSVVKTPRKTSPLAHPLALHSYTLAHPLALDSYPLAHPLALDSYPLALPLVLQVDSYPLAQVKIRLDRRSRLWIY